MCERMPVCGCAEMCGNRETRTIPAFASVSTVRKLCGNCAENAFRLHAYTRDAIPMRARR